MRLGVGERERRAPRATEHLPALDAEVLAQLLDIVDEMPCRVLIDASMRRGAAAATLVEQHDAVAVRVVIATHDGGGTAARSAMQQQGGVAARVAAFLVVELVQCGNLEPARAVGSDLRIKAEAFAGRYLTLIHGVAILHHGAPVGEWMLLARRLGPPS